MKEEQTFWLSKEFVCFDDVHIVPQYSEVASRYDGTTSDSFPGLDIPVFASCMDTVTGIKMMRTMEQLGAGSILHRWMSPEEAVETVKKAELLAPPNIAVGTIKKDEEKRRIDLLLENFTAPTLCVDVAHGHSPAVADTVKYIKDRRPDTFVIAGNVATAAGADYLVRAGADALRVGVGGGSVCSTRIKTGCGLPTLGSIIECSKYMEEKAFLIADGGIKTPAHVAIAIAAGAHAVLLGGMLAGTDAVPNWTRPGDKIIYRGMASKEAREAYGKPVVMSEGVSRTVICKEEGSSARVVTSIQEGLLSAMGYVGACNMHEFQHKALLARVSTLTVQESSPHFRDGDL